MHESGHILFSSVSKWCDKRQFLPYSLYRYSIICKESISKHINIRMLMIHKKAKLNVMQEISQYKLWKESSEYDYYCRFVGAGIN